MGKSTSRQSGQPQRAADRVETDAEEAERISLTVENPEPDDAPAGAASPWRPWSRTGPAGSGDEQAEPLSLSKTAVKIADPLRLKWLFREIGRLLFAIRARAVRPQTPQEAQALASAWLFSEEEQAECSAAVVNAINALPITIPHLNEASAAGEALGTVAAVLQRKLAAEQAFMQAARNPTVTPDGLQRFPQPGTPAAEPAQSA